MINEKTAWRRAAACAVIVVTMGLAVADLRSQETNRKIISGPTPIYPDLARKAHLTGTVKVQVVIGTDGKIKEVKVIGGHPLLVDAVQETLKNWKYAPASTETGAILQFNFHE